MSLVIRIIRIALVGVLCGPPVVADVLTVGPAGAFAEIHQALAIAVDGDTVLVSAGAYQGFTIDGLSVSVIAEVGDFVRIKRPVTVENLAAGQVVLLERLKWEGPYAQTTATPVLSIVTNQGSVRVERCTVEGETDSVPDTRVAVRVAESVDVAFVGCTLVGGDVTLTERVGAPAVLVGGSTCAYQTCQVTGGRGADGFVELDQFDGWAGGAGMDVAGSAVTISGGTIQGGAGGNGLGCQFTFNGDGGAGGPGVRSVGVMNQARIRDSVVLGGPGGIAGWMGPDCGDSFDGAVGPGVEGVGVIPVAGLHRTLVFPVMPVRELSPFNAAVNAEAGDFAVLLWSVAPANAPVGGASGQLLLSPVPLLHVLPLGFVPGSGPLTISTSVPELGLGVESVRVYLQLFVQAANGDFVLGSPVTVVALDSAF